MRVRNVHERAFPAHAAVGELIDTLATRDDALWPRATWPRIAFDRPLQVGAVGGHGPVRYVVESYRPGCSITFRFTKPSGFDGTHTFEIVPTNDGTTLLRHTIEMRTQGLAVLSWPLVFRPLHDALLEDAMSTAEASLRLPVALRPWSRWVRLLRWATTGGRARPQMVSATALGVAPGTTS